MSFKSTRQNSRKNLLYALSTQDYTRSQQDQAASIVQPPFKRGRRQNRVRLEKRGYSTWPKKNGILKREGYFYKGKGSLKFPSEAAIFILIVQISQKAHKFSKNFPCDSNSKLFRFFTSSS